MQLRLLATTLLVFLSAHANAEREHEKLDRGVVAVQQPDGTAFVSWRLLDSDPLDVAFNVYRETVVQQRTDFGKFSSRDDSESGVVRLNPSPLREGTWFVDSRPDFAHEARYFVKRILDGKEEDATSAAYVVHEGSLPVPYHSIHLQTPPGYAPNDASIADLDGDGRYEIVLHQVGVGKDNSQVGMTTPPIFQAYTLDGKLLWQINLGKNIREGAHYTQFLVYDFDGDGKAEFVCKTADGSVDGVGHVIGDANANWLIDAAAAKANGSEGKTEGSFSVARST
jgi:rhamnogalacturonan endolyase